MTSRATVRLVRLKAARQVMDLPPVRWLVVAAALGLGLAIGAAASRSRVQWGTVGEWVSGLATTAGLLFAGYQILLTRRQRVEEELARLTTEKEERVALARAAGLRWTFLVVPEERQVHFRVHNGSKYPISDVCVWVPDLGEGPSRIGTASFRGLALPVVTVLLPGETFPAYGQPARVARLHWPRELPPGITPPPKAYLSFLDTWGERWMRSDTTLDRRDDWTAT